MGQHEQGSRVLVLVLALIWFVLCTSLVTKHLVTILFSFVCCFGLAAVLQVTSRSPKETDGLPLSAHANVKMRVGWAACAAAGIWVVLPKTWPWRDEFAVESDGFQSLSIVAGSLAFDLWYSLLFCKNNTRATILSLAENTIFLTLFLFLLVRDESRVQRSSTHIAAYIEYLFYRLSLCEQSSNSSRSESRTKNPDGSAPLELLWEIHGVKYDLADFVSRHPGGREAILLGRSRDCTALFESYHPFTTVQWDVLAKYRVVAGKGILKSSSQPERRRDEFYEVLKVRVASVLRQHGIDPIKDRGANLQRYLYYAGVFLGLCLSAKQHVQGKPLGSLAFAFFAWIAGALGHDAGHFSVSRHPIGNDIFVWAMGFISNPMVWQHQHTYAHHSHTNDFHHDPDLHHFGFLRLHRRRKHCAVHVNQSNALYVLAAYTSVVVGTCLRIPLFMMTNGKLNVTVDWTYKDRPLCVIGMILHWVVFVAVVIVAPFTAGVNENLLSRFFATFVFLTTSGLLYAFFTQVNHLNEECLEGTTPLSSHSNGSSDNQPSEKRTKSNDKDSRNVREASWAMDQVETSNNFATRSTFLFYLSNGLNFQIEHHLFPGLNPCHLHLIAPTVKATCSEYGVKYREYDSWQQVMQSLLNWLDKLSVNTE